MFSDKNDTIESLRVILTGETQWSDLINKFLRMINVNMKTEEIKICTMGKETYPYHICNILIPQFNAGYL